MNPRPLLTDQSTVPDIGFDGLFEVEPLLMHSVDENATLLNVSTAWARLLGYEREDLIGRRTVDIMSPKSRAYALTRGLPALYTNGHVSNISYEFLRSDGRPIPVLLSSGAIYDAQGRFSRSLTIITDDRRARYAERELNARNRRDVDGAGALRDLLERLGHDTRTPLGAILGFAGLMEQGELDEAQRGRLAQVLTAAETLRTALDAALADAEARLVPQRRSSTPMSRQGEPPPSLLPLAPLRVLLAVGEASRQDSLREILRAGGHHVVAVANGYEAIEALFAGPIDLAFIDLDMPGLSGPATVAQIRNSGRCFRDIPVIACSGTDDPPALAALRGKGMDGLLPAACTPGTLEAEMRRVLESRSP
ncbi:MAG: PAS domain S-box protein [Vannielia sp.]|uniref:ATP-binding response regulator n=1 Tax=Vannielia sp. TaxID=2813045 RepID=UPI003B8CEE50